MIQIETNPGVNLNDLKLIKGRLLIIFADAKYYCERKGLRFCVTSLFTDNVKGRVSRTHLDCRAFDLSVYRWNKRDIADFTLYLKNKYEAVWGAISAETGDRCLIPPINHGTGKHFHIQISPY